MEYHVTTQPQATAHAVLLGICACLLVYVSIEASLHEGLVQMPHGKMLPALKLVLIVRMPISHFKFRLSDLGNS